MGRAIAALCGAALLFSAITLGLGLHRAIGSAWYVGMILVGMALMLGFPVLGLFCKRRWWEPWRFVVGGALGGALCSLPFVGAGNFNVAFLIVTLALVGAAVAVPFWVAAVWRNDDLTCPKEFCLPCGAVYRFARGVMRRPARD